MQISSDKREKSWDYERTSLSRTETRFAAGWNFAKIAYQFYHVFWSFVCCLDVQNSKVFLWKLLLDSLECFFVCNYDEIKPFLTENNNEQSSDQHFCEVCSKIIILKKLV